MDLVFEILKAIEGSLGGSPNIKFILEDSLTTLILVLLTLITAYLLKGAYWLVSRYSPPLGKVYIASFLSLSLSIIGYFLFFGCVCTLYPETLYNSNSGTLVLIIYLPIGLLIQTAITGFIIKKPETTKRFNFSKACLASTLLDTVIISGFYWFY
jgi:cytochrome bd-type quinol oxidase subunit 2